MIKDRNDFVAGFIFVAVGLLYAALSFDLNLGTALDMGPGYFPLVLCSILILLGAAIIGKSLIASTGAEFGTVPWRALIMLPLAIVVFGVFLTYLGLLPTVFVTALIASRSSSDTSWKMSVVVSLALAIFCTLIFVNGVGLPIPILGSWFVN